MWIKTYKTHQNTWKNTSKYHIFGDEHPAVAAILMFTRRPGSKFHSGTMQVWPLPWLLQPWSIRQTLGWGLFENG